MQLRGRYHVTLGHDIYCVRDGGSILEGNNSSSPSQEKNGDQIEHDIRAVFLGGKTFLYIYVQLDFPRGSGVPESDSELHPCTDIIRAYNRGRN